MKKAIISVLSAIVGAIAGAIAVSVRTMDERMKIQKMSDKHLELFLMMNQWVKVKQEGKSLVSYFETNGYKRIAVYGMSHVGETFVDELRGTGIEVAYGIDQNADFIYADIDIMTMEDSLDSVDVIVVTAITFFDEIEEKLSEKVECPIISLEDVLYAV